MLSHPSGNLETKHWFSERAENNLHHWVIHTVLRFKILSDFSVGPRLQKAILLDFRITMIVLEKMATKRSGTIRSCWLIGESTSLWEKALSSLLPKPFFVPVDSLLVAKYSNLSSSTTAACILPWSPLWW